MTPKLTPALDHVLILSRHSDTEEAVRDQNRNVNTMDYRVKYLEKENGVLQDRIDTLSRQRVAMEKLIREYRLEKQKMVSNSEKYEVWFVLTWGGMNMDDPSCLFSAKQTSFDQVSSLVEQNLQLEDGQCCFFLHLPCTSRRRKNHGI